MSKQKKSRYRKAQHYNLIKSFSFAVSGIGFALLWERNLRIHLIAAAVVGYFSLRYYSFSKAEQALLVLAITLVIVSELLNTAIEKNVDLATSDYSPLAMIAKDVAAGAVLFSSIGALVVGVILFWEPDTLMLMLNDVLGQLYIWIPLLIASLILIFLPERVGFLGKEKDD